MPRAAAAAPGKAGRSARTATPRLGVRARPATRVIEEHAGHPLPPAGPRRVVLQDADEKDLYTRTLATKFTEQLPPGRLVDKEPTLFDSSMTSLGTVFTNQMAGLCAKNPDVIYFAGRGRDLPKFLAPLAKTHCAEKPLTVLTGDDASQVLQVNGADEVKQALRDSHIKLVFTGLAHPGAWATDPGAFNQATVAPFRTGGTFDTSFSDEQLDDGQAIMGYDCVLTAVHTIRLGNSPQVTGSDVLGEIHALPARTSRGPAAGSPY